MKVRNVKVNSLASVFTDSTLSTFTQSALNKGVTDDSVIYIVCSSSDAATYGSLYVEGSHWIWAKGELFSGDYFINDTTTSTSKTWSSNKTWDEFTDVVISDSATSVPDIDIHITATDVSGKADKVTSATSGNFAGLDSNGNLTDSGKNASDFLTDSDLSIITYSGEGNQIDALFA